MSGKKEVIKQNKQETPQSVLSNKNQSQVDTASAYILSLNTT